MVRVLRDDRAANPGDYAHTVRRRLGGSEHRDYRFRHRLRVAEYIEKFANPYVATEHGLP